MHAGIAFSNTAAAFAAGQDLARTAAAQAGISSIDVLLLFCSANTDYQRLLDGARAVCGPNTQILGGSAVGVITNDEIHLQGYPAAALALSSKGNSSEGNNTTFSSAVQFCNRQCCNISSNGKLFRLLKRILTCRPI